MEVKAISFTGKAPKTTQIKKAFEKAMAGALEHSDRDYLNLSRKAKAQPKSSGTDLIEKAKEFFSNFFE